MSNPVILCTLLFLSLFSLSFSLTVDEIHSQSLYLNIPLSVSTLRQLVNPILTIDTFNDMGWLTLECFHLDRLRIQTPLGWLDTLTGGWIVKTKVAVSYKGDFPGQLILDMDFDSDVAGGVDYLGCVSTQPEINCHDAISMNRTDVSGFVTQTMISDGSTIIAKLSTGKNLTDPNLVAFIMAHYMNKYEGKPGGTVKLSLDSGNFPVYPYRSLEVVDIVTDLLRNRFSLEVGDICGSGECFVGADNYLIDTDGSIIT